MLSWGVNSSLEWLMGCSWCSVCSLGSVLTRSVLILRLPSLDALGSWAALKECYINFCNERMTELISYDDGAIDVRFDKVTSVASLITTLKVLMLIGFKCPMPATAKAFVARSSWSSCACFSFSVSDLCICCFCVFQWRPGDRTV